MKREFLGTYTCQRCYKVRVRVYDWLPECVLCAKCKATEWKHDQRKEDGEEFLKSQTEKSSFPVES